MHFLLETSPGEFLDKLTILEIKSERIRDPGKLANVTRELALMRRLWDAATGIDGEVPALVAELKSVNEELWVIEDRIRECEATGSFDATFVTLARSVYHTNDRRATLKRRINALLGSELVEEKSYSEYRRKPV
jgi:Family of unknown function (DUF6165)